MILSRYHVEIVNITREQKLALVRPSVTHMVAGRWSWEFGPKEANQSPETPAAAQADRYLTE